MPVDYVGTYFTPDGFDFSRLGRVNFIQPVRLPFQARYFVSVSKLVMIAIASIDNVQFGNNTARGIPRSGYGKN